MSSVDRLPEELFGNQRCAQRSVCEIPALVSLSNDLTCEVVAEDVSMWGMRIRSPLFLGFGSQVKMQIVWRATTLVVGGRVCWCRRGRDGCEAGIELNRPLNLDLEKIAG